MGNNSNMSLSLLSARVNARKTMTLAVASAASGANNSAQSLKIVRPIAASLAKSSLLYKSLMCDDELHSTYRWSPPEPVKITNKPPEFFDPSVPRSYDMLRGWVSFDETLNNPKAEACRMFGDIFQTYTQGNCLVLVELFNIHMEVGNEKTTTCGFDRLANNMDLTFSM